MTETFKTICMILMASVVGLVLVNSASASAHKDETRSIDDLVWVKGGEGLHFALLWGDWTKGDYGMVVKIEAGHAAPTHSHTSDYHGVTIQGNWVHSYSEDDVRTLPPGSYAFQPGKENHGDRCEGPMDCLILIHQHGPRDFVLPGM